MLVEGLETRKSERIAAIEAAKRVNKRGGNAANPAEAGKGPSSQNDTGSRRRRSRKRKRLDEVAESSLSPPNQQDDGEGKYENHAIENGYFPSMHQMPEKHILENALNILQREDKHKIFAKSVDDEVDCYYQVIEEPMDFSTLRTKLQEEKYNTFEEFEYDVLLVSKNAMFFNGDTTVYHKQAQAMYELSKRVLKTIKTDPEKLEQVEHEISLEKQQTGRKCKSKARNSRTPKRTKHETIQDRPWSSTNKLINQRENNILSGCSQYHGAKKLALSRDSYNPFVSPNSMLSEVFNGPKHLVPGDGGIGYRESLERFTEKLGPTAQRVAARKLENVGPHNPSQSQISPSFIGRSFLTSSSSQRESPFAFGVGGREAPILPFNLARNSVTDTNASDPLNTQRDCLGRSRADKGKNVVIDDEIHGGYMDLLTKNCYEDYLGKLAPERRGIRVIDDSQEIPAPRGKTGILSALEGERSHGSDGMAGNPLGIINSPNHFKEIIQPADREFFRAFINDVHRDNLENPAGIQGFDSPTSRVTSVINEVYPENQSFLSQTGSSLSDTAAVNLNYTTAGIKAAHDKMVGSSQLQNQVPSNQLAGGSGSSLLEAIPRNNRRTKTSVYPSTYLRPSKFSRISNMLHASGASRNPGYTTNSAPVNSVLELSKPTANSGVPLVIHDLSKVQPPQLVGNSYGVQHNYQASSTYQRLLSLGEIPSVQGAHSVATEDMQQLPMIKWGQNATAEEEMQLALASYMEVPNTEANLLCQNSWAPTEMLQLGLGHGLCEAVQGASAKNQYLKPNNLNYQLGQLQPQRSQVAGPSNVPGQWRSTLPLGRDTVLKQERQLMPPPPERMSVARTVDGRNLQESQEARSSFLSGSMEIHTRNSNCRWAEIVYSSKKGNPSKFGSTTGKQASATNTRLLKLEKRERQQTPREIE